MEGVEKRRDFDLSSTPNSWCSVKQSAGRRLSGQLQVDISTVTCGDAKESVDVCGSVL